jgi:hypothetical protein
MASKRIGSCRSSQLPRAASGSCTLLVFMEGNPACCLARCIKQAALPVFSPSSPACSSL